MRRDPLSPLSLTLHLDLADGTDQVAGNATDGHWTSEIAGDRNVFNERLNPARQAGPRSFLLNHAGASISAAAAGSAAINASGAASVVGKLAAGRAFSLSSTLARSGDYPFYLTFNHGTEVFIGWLNFPAATAAPTGTVIWVRTGKNPVAATLQAAAK